MQIKVSCHSPEHFCYLPDVGSKLALPPPSLPPPTKKEVCKDLFERKTGFEPATLSLGS